MGAFQLGREIGQDVRPYCIGSGARFADVTQHAYNCIQSSVGKNIVRNNKSGGGGGGGGGVTCSKRTAK